MSAGEKAIRRYTKHALRDALALGAQGFHVFPIGLHNPRREGNGWKFDKLYYKDLLWGTAATCDPEAIATLFSAYPDAAVGIATGPSRLVVIDRDDLDVELELPIGFQYPTARGGRHHWTRPPKDMQIKSRSDWVTPDGVVLKGIDIKAFGGMVVYYGPKITEKLHIPKSPAWTHVPTTLSGPKAAPDIAFEDWLGQLRPGKMTDRTRELVRSVPLDGMTHDEMLEVQSELARLGANGVSGIPTAIEKARERYTRNFPAYVTMWDKGMLGAAQHFGPPLPATAIIAGPPKASKRKKGKKKGKGGDDAPEPEPKPKAPRTHPDEFFDKEKLYASFLADVVNWKGDLAAGKDGTIWRYQNGVYRRDEKVVTARCVARLGDRYRIGHAATAESVILHRKKTPEILGEPNPDLINVRNGMLDWRTGKLSPHSTLYRSTVQLPVSYDPDATAPLFEQWLDSVAPKSLHVVIWELIAYACMSGNPRQKAVMLLGPGGTGKGTLLRLIERLCGDENMSALSPEDMGGKFESAELFGMLINIFGDLNSKYLPDSGAFKRATGGDTITAQRKGMDPFKFRPWAFPVFGANEVAASPDVTSGYFRRWIVIPFKRPVDLSTVFDERRLHAEADGIFSTAIKHLPRVIADGFTETLETIEAKNDFAQDSDIIRSWLADDEHVLTHEPGHPTARTKRSHLYDVYATWAEHTGHRNVLSRIRFSRRLEMIGFEITASGGDRVVRGIAVDTVSVLDSLANQAHRADLD